MSKKKQPTFDVWVERKHTFTVKIIANSLEEALAEARKMSIDELLDAPGETVDSEHEFTAVMR